MALRKRSRLLFHYRAHECSLRALTGQVGAFARASIATAVDARGRTYSAVQDQPRFTWVNGVPHLLLEVSRTNAWTWSEQLDNAAWTKSDTSITANATIAPDGTATADKLVENTAGGVAHFLQRSTGTYSADRDQSVSVFVKAAERTHGRFYIINGSDRTGVRFNLTAGTITPFVAGTGLLARSSITRFADGWYRVEITGKTGPAFTSSTAVVLLEQSDNVSNYVGDGVSGMYVWGLQFEADAPCASSYIKTEGSTATRSADNLTYDFLVPPRDLTMYARFVERGTSLITSGRIAQISSSIEPRLVLVTSGSFRYAINHGNGVSAVSSSLFSDAPELGDTVELCGTLSATGSVRLFQAINGASETSSTESSGLSFASAWADGKLVINRPTFGLIALESLKIAAGVHSLADMRRMF